MIRRLGVAFTTLLPRAVALSDGPVQGCEPEFLSSLFRVPFSGPFKPRAEQRFTGCRPLLSRTRSTPTELHSLQLAGRITSTNDPLKICPDIILDRALGSKGEVILKVLLFQ